MTISRSVGTALMGIAPAGSVAAQEVTAKLGTSLPDSHPQTIGARKFGEPAEKPPGNRGAVVNSLVKRVLEWLLVGLLGLMVVLVFGNVVLRYGFNSGIVFSEEMSRFVFMWLTLLGALLAMAEGAHLGMTSVIARLPVAGQRVARFTSDLLMLACCGLLAHGTWKQVVLAMDDRSPVLGIPMGLVFSGLLICGCGIALILLRSLWRQVAGLMPADELIAGHEAQVE